MKLESITRFDNFISYFNSREIMIVFSHIYTCLGIIYQCQTFIVLEFYASGPVFLYAVLLMHLNIDII